MYYRNRAKELPEILALKKLADDLYDPYKEVADQSKEHYSAVEAYNAAINEVDIKNHAAYLARIAKTPISVAGRK